MKTIQDINTARQELALVAIAVANASRSQAEGLSTKIERLDTKISKLGTERWVMRNERDALIKQALECEVFGNA